MFRYRCNCGFFLKNLLNVNFDVYSEVFYSISKHISLSYKYVTDKMINTTTISLTDLITTTSASLFEMFRHKVRHITEDVATSAP